MGVIDVLGTMFSNKGMKPSLVGVVEGTLQYKVCLLFNFVLKT